MRYHVSMHRSASFLSSFLTSKRTLFIEVFVLCIVVACGFLLRINVFDVTGESYFHVDVARDHLVATRILSFGEFPSTGPDGYFGPLGNSPLYYYLIAGLLWIDDSILFPGLVNVFLQTLSIVLVYLIARPLFGRVTALAAAVLFAFSDGIVAQAMQMWQPHLMQLFLLCSMLLCIHGIRNRRPLFLWGSALLFTLSFVIHNSVLAAFPVYGAVLGWALHRQKYSIRTALGMTAACAFILCAAYASVVYTHLHVAEVMNAPEVVQNAATDGIVRIGQFAERSLYLFSYLFEGSLIDITWYTYLLAAFFGIGSVLYLCFQKDTRKRAAFAVLFFGVLLLVGGVGVLSLSSGGFPIRYFTPIYVPFLIIIAELVIAPYRARWFVWPLQIVVILAIAYVSSEYVRSRFDAFPHRIATEGIVAVYPEYAYPQDVAAITAYIYEKGYGTNIDIRTIEREYEELYRNELVWLALESKLGQQLVTLDPRQFRGYAPIGSREHMFIRCINTEEQSCRRVFERRYAPEYEILGVVYESPLVRYLYAHTDPHEGSHR